MPDGGSGTFPDENQNWDVIMRVEAQKGNRKRLLEVMKSRHEDIRVLVGYSHIDVTQKDGREEDTCVVDE